MGTELAVIMETKVVSFSCCPDFASMKWTGWRGSVGMTAMTQRRKGGVFSPVVYTQ